MALINYKKCEKEINLTILVLIIAVIMPSKSLHAQEISPEIYSDCIYIYEDYVRQIKVNEAICDKTYPSWVKGDTRHHECYRRIQPEFNAIIESQSQDCIDVYYARGFLPFKKPFEAFKNPPANNFTFPHGIR